MKSFMKKAIAILTSITFIVTALLFVSQPVNKTEAATKPTIVNHRYTKLTNIPKKYILAAKDKLNIAYGHTSHGSQLVYGMSGLVDFKGSLYSFNSSGSNGALNFKDCPFTGADDLGNPNYTEWATATRNYLKTHKSINVVMWSWCGQVSGASKSDISTYLSRMNALEKDFPNVKFVYMTGHLDGSGLTGNLHIRNNQIRSYCKTYNKILYDFADIETYNPDGTYFGRKTPDDGCNYDSNGDGSNDSNWAINWQNKHPVNVSWYDCGAAHSESLNGNQKAYAAWSLFARLAGWNGYIPVKYVKLNKNTLTLAKGKTYKLTQKVYSIYSSNRNVYWTSSNKSIITITGKGVVKGIRRGTAYIKVHTVNGNKTAKCTVTVK